MVVISLRIEKTKKLEPINRGNLDTMASFAFGRTLLQLAGRLGLKPSDLSKVDDIAFVGTGEQEPINKYKIRS